MSFVTTQLPDILHEASPIISLCLLPAQVYRHDSYDIGDQSDSAYRHRPTPALAPFTAYP